jgi:hypothetical protein
VLDPSFLPNVAIQLCLFFLFVKPCNGKSEKGAALFKKQNRVFILTRKRLADPFVVVAQVLIPSPISTVVPSAPCAFLASTLKKVKRQAGVRYLIATLLCLRFTIFFHVHLASSIGIPWIITVARAAHGVSAL